MTRPSVQGALFQRIRENLADQTSLAETIGSLLHVSNDSAYRRIRGETPLVLEEAKILCGHFGISLDELFGHKSRQDLTFTLFPAFTAQDGFDDFLIRIEQQLTQILSFRQHEMYYLTKDIPIFHQFSFRPLFAFRYFFWMKSIVQHPDFLHLSFSPDLLPDATAALGARILELYNRIPTTEIWNTECVNSILLQLEFYRQSEFFASPADCELVYNALEQTIRHLNAQTTQGCKFRPEEPPEYKPENFHLYSNRIVLGDNTIVVLTDEHKSVFINHDVLDYMSTRDEQFCNDTYNKLRNLVRRSTHISQVSEKQRFQFFSVMLDKLSRSRTKAFTNVIAG